MDFLKRMLRTNYLRHISKNTKRKRLNETHNVKKIRSSEPIQQDREEYANRNQEIDCDEKEDNTQEDETLIDVLFKDPHEDHFQGIKMLLETLYPRKYCSEIASAIITQSYVGTILTTDESYVVGFASILNLQSHQSIGLFAFILHKIGPMIPSRFSHNQIGILIQGKFVNTPTELAPSLLKCLTDDISWTIQNLANNEGSAAFAELKYILILSPVAPGTVIQGQTEICVACNDDDNTRECYYWEHEEFAKFALLKLNVNNLFGGESAESSVGSWPITAMLISLKKFREVVISLSSG